VKLPSTTAVQEAVEQQTLTDILNTPLPAHTKMVRGQLANGLNYIVLPNAAPPQRFEAHLEVLAGSADEMEHQQGMAHLVEHISYMGSRKRERLFGTGSQTNAYTDFHHTVFYAACPLLTPPGWGRRQSMLPRALEALCDVMEAKCEDTRLEKERAAVLSEKSMVNTIDYRVECRILSALHGENILAQRFPIGKEHLIRAWTAEDVKTFHRTHYRPDNVMLYVIGDIDPATVVDQIDKTFGHLSCEPRPEVVPPTLKQLQSAHFPPVTHHWSMPQHNNHQPPMGQSTEAKAEKMEAVVFQHELLQAFSFHLFAKRPIEPVETLADFRRAIMRRIALAALQIRLNVNTRSDQLFTMIEFNQLDSPREGCAVCYLDLTANPRRWREAVATAVKEIRRLGLYGLTNQELARYSTALLTDTQQLAAQGDRISNGDQLQFLMESVACGHTFMDSTQTFEATRLACQTITLEEVNQVAADICEHVGAYALPGLPQPSAAVACVPSALPTADGRSMQFQLSPEEIHGAISEGTQAEIEPEVDVAVPEMLLLEDDVNENIARFQPHWLEMKEAAGTVDPTTFYEPKTDVTMKKLSNGIQVNMRYSGNESQRGHMRIMVPGGRSVETLFGTGAVAVGAKTMQEGGAFGTFTREQVELFCIDHLLLVHIDCNEEFLVLDFLFPTTKRHQENVEGKKAGEKKGGISGLEASLQVVHQIFTGFVWEEDALARAKQGFKQSHETLTKSLEGKTTEELMGQISGMSDRFMSVPADKIDVLTLEQVKGAVMSQLTTDSVEVSLAGDMQVDELQHLVLKYLGSIPPSKRLVEAPVEDLPVGAVTPSTQRHLDVFLPDSDERAVAYVAGLAPNRWGRTRGQDPDGPAGLVDALKDQHHQATASSSSSSATSGAAGGPSPGALRGATPGDTPERWDHPMFPNVALALLREVINRRLFSTVREQKRLTYDANFHLTSFERLLGSWYLITVTASPQNAQLALQACRETIRDLTTMLPITPDNAESAKRVLINKHESDLRTNQYWVEMMSGLQSPSVSCKDISCIRDFVSVVNSVTARDLQMVLKTLTVNEAEMYTAIGISGKME